MKYFNYYLMICFGLLVMGGHACAEEVQSASTAASEAIFGYASNMRTDIQPMAEGMNDKISLDLRSIDVGDALKYLALKAGISIITTNLVSGRVTLVVKDVLIKDVFDIMLRSNNLAYDIKGGIYNVMTEAEYKALYGENFSDVRQVQMFRLKYAIPEQVFNLLEVLKSDIGRVLVDVESGKVLVIDSPEKIKVMKRALEGFESKNLVRVFELNYARAKDIEAQLKAQLNAKKVGLVKADERSNQVIVQTLPERMKEIEALIYLLDRKTKQIIIEAQIVKVSLSDGLTSGVEWEGLFDVSPQGDDLAYIGSTPFAWTGGTSSDAWQSRQATYQEAGYVGSYPFSGTTSSLASATSSVGAGEMHLGMVGNNDFDIILKYLQTLGETRIISTPKLAVVNNEEAKIHVGQKEAYVTTTTTTGQTTSTMSEEVTFVDVGVMLSVVPTINEEGFITLKIKSEISNVIDILITPTENQIPIIDTSLAETTVLVKEGSTIVIGGLRKEQEMTSYSGLPALGRIPFLGRLFSTNISTKTITELLIVLTPKLITGERLSVESRKHKDRLGQEIIKSVKDYTDLESEVYVPLDEDERLVTKGFKTK